MPELPDVEIFRRYAEKYALNKEITGIEYKDDSMLESGKSKITRSLKGEPFVGTRRLGKYLFLKSKSKNWLVLHFGMTGQLKYFDNSSQEPEYSRFIIQFDNHHSLACISRRKLGKIEITDDPDDYISGNELGQDALEMEWGEFYEIMSSKKGGIKNALMDQSKISGIGNVYSDEILFQERIHPKNNIGKLEKKQLRSLYETMREVLKEVIKHGADPENLPDRFLLSNRKEGAKCPECNGTIQKITINGRGTYICPDCQKPDNK